MWGRQRESRERNTAATLIYDEQFESEFTNVDSANIQDVSKQWAVWKTEGGFVPDLNLFFLAGDAFDNKTVMDSI